ncbi:peptidase M19 renal dipeptidase [Dinoroseobacter shibae DFL 12 = DSM 16493]|jgi:microsomal dipeptidase-like Zn-dependent dipeptidase|uniref:Peptidase M19 renal dipeptidase n=1 Tax=Dinoroseobacter shibae (strain DSM 16493 / NCIMB 14021 / DFL 12) TaxID=398580 RepID=A8LPK1_DINSH|nr:membrane dipeptidase [Dinoroseobacter shibae]ABV92324.1 peptidase M19 renal dipeptidase [Dinoroseobacter shibae DFL 12 = DSM 16493]URF47272.1 dipeptidase [Dinoroseobacter shibae]URF51583.1 dipeptidase [Dinoroseobacter shibae]
MSYLIDGLQYANWSEKIFRQMRAGGVDAVHVTITYHETFRETVLVIEQWNRWFEQFPDLIFQGRTADDVCRARETGRTAIFFGSQNPSCIEDDIGLVEVLHTLGLRFMQLTYNNQSLLASGCYEDEDTGLTRMGRQVVAEMNRVGLVVDMSHSGERSTFEAIAQSTRPVTISHANPASWHKARRNKSDDLLRALGQSGGFLGLSVYPHHLKDGGDCTLQSWCDMAALAVDLMGPQNVGIGTDLCQDQPDSIVEWMRVGRWTKAIDYGEGSAANAGFPSMPNWFRDNRDLAGIRAGLRAAGLDEATTDGIMGDNWHAFFARSFGRQDAPTTKQDAAE